MKYSIREIAELTGVAVSTVSKALNGQKGVSEEKRAEIIKLAAEYNYIPNAAARALSHNKSDAIGILISSDIEYTLASFYWLEILSAVAGEVERNNCNLLIITQGKNGNLKSLESTILKKAVDGLVIPSEQLNPDILQLLQRSNIPFVLQGRSSILSDHYCVDVRNEDGAVRLTAKLIEKGYKKIGCLAGPEAFLYCKERVSGFKSVMKENGISNAPVVYTQYSEEDAKKKFRAFFKKNQQLDAVFIAAGGDFLYYALDVMQELNFNLAKTGFAVFDDCRRFHYLPCKVISAVQPIRQMGIQDTKTLFQLINGESPPKLSLFDITLIE